MAAIRSTGNKDTELRFLAMMRRNGITGWRRHAKLPGRPDFLFRQARVAVFIDGCFWHGCARCYRAPNSNAHYWGPKIERNRARDKKTTRVLREAGWRVLRFWECSLQRESAVVRRVADALSRSGTEHAGSSLSSALDPLKGRSTIQSPSRTRATQSRPTRLAKRPRVRPLASPQDKRPPVRRTRLAR